MGLSFLSCASAITVKHTTDIVTFPHIGPCIEVFMPALHSQDVTFTRAFCTCTGACVLTTVRPRFHLQQILCSIMLAPPRE